MIPEAKTGKVNGFTSKPYGYTKFRRPPVRGINMDNWWTTSRGACMASSQLMTMQADLKRHKIEKEGLGGWGGWGYEMGRKPTKTYLNTLLSDTPSKHTEISDFSIPCQTEEATRTELERYTRPSRNASIQTSSFQSLIGSNLFRVLQ